MNRILVLASVLVHALAFAGTIGRGAAASGVVALYDVKLTVPAGWRVTQEATSGQTTIIGLSKGSQYVTVYAVPQTGLSLKSMFGKEAQVTQAEVSEAKGPFSWRVMESNRQWSFQGENKQFFVKGFLTEHAKHTYFGFSRAESAEDARTAAELIRGSFVTAPIAPIGRSLTSANYTGKKYYFGWGAAGSFDPAMMHNEVKYDVQHTHDVFGKEVGGNYLATTLIGPGATNGKTIRKAWSELKNKITADDMYVQYSSGHGSKTGLAVGVRYTDMRDFALSLPAREIVIFTMACHSGGLVDAFNQKKSQWQDWQNSGRTLLVMSSSRTSETSATGPGTDPGQPGGPKGSAGSAFGHALWKALVGEADGYLDGIKDGFVSLGEIRDYARFRTYQLAKHLPMETGTFEPGLIMNRVPSREFLASLGGGTENLTDDQIMNRIEELDRAMRLESKE